MTLDELQPFCSKDPNRPSLHKPFSIYEHTYATDGIMAIQVPLIEGVGENLAAPNSIVRIIIGQSPRQWYPVPKVDMTQTECPDCRGSGKCHQCPECKGDGEVYPRTGWNEYGPETCLTCDGNGQLTNEGWNDLKARKKSKLEPCERCDGVGTRRPSSPIRLGNQYSAPAVLAKIGALPAAEIGPGKGKHDVACFRFAGGVCVVMPVRPE